MKTFDLGYPRTELRRELAAETVEERRLAHERFFGCAIEPETPIVAIRFRLVQS